MMTTQITEHPAPMPLISGSHAARLRAFVINHFGVPFCTTGWDPLTNTCQEQFKTPNGPDFPAAVVIRYGSPDEGEITDGLESIFGTDNDGRATWAAIFNDSGTCCRLDGVKAHLRDEAAVNAVQELITRAAQGAPEHTL